MWAFQQHFRLRVQLDIQEVLSRIGLQTNGKIEVLLIGLATRDEPQHHICIEPEDGPLAIDDLQSLSERTNAILEADPESEVSYSNARIHKQQKHELFLRSRALAIAEAIETSGKFEGSSFVVSNSAPLAGYDVHTCVGIPRDALESVPSFNNPMKEDYHGRHIEESFVQAIIRTCLSKADKALYLPHPGQSLGGLGDRIDTIWVSAERFTQGIAFVLTPALSDLFMLANEFSSQTYERSGARGNLVVTSYENLANKLKITFQKPVDLNETRNVRKILELTDETKALTFGWSLYLWARRMSPCPRLSQDHHRGTC